MNFNQRLKQVLPDRPTVHFRGATWPVPQSAMDRRAVVREWLNVWKGLQPPAGRVLGTQHGWFDPSGGAIQPLLKRLSTDSPKGAPGFLKPEHLVLATLSLLVPIGGGVLTERLAQRLQIRRLTYWIETGRWRLGGIFVIWLTVVMVLHAFSASVVLLVLGIGLAAITGVKMAAFLPLAIIAAIAWLGFRSRMNRFKTSLEAYLSATA